MRAWGRVAAGAAASALLLALYANGQPWLGFVLLVPWLLALAALPRARDALAAGVLMAMLYKLAALGWFGSALAAYLGLPAWLGLLLPVLAAPLLQPQLWVFALAWHWARARLRPWPAAGLAVAAWLACEWLWPKLLGDTLGHGLQPAPWLRQAADLGGAPLLSALLLLVNLALVQAWQGRGRGWRGARPGLLAAGALVLALAGYGGWRLQQLQAAPSEVALRFGLVQSGLTDYEGLRRRLGTHEAMAQILARHIGLSRQALDVGGIDALVWSETAYPTTFGQPRSAAGAAFDRRLLDFVRRSGVPLVFGTYDRDSAGEYNAAAFVDPRDGLLGFYRKTHPFPFTEHVPGWLDGPRLRRWLPWTGTWQAGDGARTFPLRLRDGRELPVAASICLDDVHPALAREAARQGARLLLGLSNDAWFAAHPQGARLHLTVAALNSVQTRLPQLRVTPSGITAVIAADGGVRQQAPRALPTVLVGEIAVAAPPRTLAVRAGDWVGPLALGVLLAFIGVHLWPRRAQPAPEPRPLQALPALWLPRGWLGWLRLLQLAVALGLGRLAWAWWQQAPLLNQPLQQLRWFAATVLIPAALVAVLRRLFAARVEWQADGVALRARGRDRRLAAHAGHARPLRLPWPAPGLRLDDGSVLLPADPAAVHAALGLPPAAVAISAWRQAWAARRRWWIDRAWCKFGLFPLLPALIAFRLHQVIAYGGSFGEWLTYGARAWLLGLLLWWAGWVVGLSVFAAGVRVGVEALVGLGALLQPAHAVGLRRLLEGLARALYFLGVPLWLAWRALA